MPKIEMLLSSLFKALAEEQQADGGFSSVTATNSEYTGTPETRYTVFYPALILLALQHSASSEQGDQIIASGIDFLLSQKSDHWSFNYWKRDSHEFRNEPYPDDLDDSALAIAACSIHKKNMVDGTVLAHLVKLLTLLEQQPRGPYATWLVNKEHSGTWHDVDVAVNSNIAYLLSLHDIRLPNIDAFLDSAIRSNNLTSQYYHSSYPITYFIARQYRGKEQKRLIAHILSTRTTAHAWENPLATALMISSLIRLGAEKKSIQPHVNALQKYSFSELRKPYPFVIEKKTGDKRFYSGSTAWTLAACIEALESFLQYRETDHHAITHREKDKSEEIYRSVTSHIEKRFEAFDTDLRERAKAVLDLMIAKDADKQIGLIAYHTWRALQQETSAAPPHFAVTLGIANMYGWMAYRIYDDFFDDEGTISLLSTANACLRECITIYSEVFSAAAERQFLSHIMDRIDAANTWEVAHCRTKKEGPLLTVEQLPEYGAYSRLADRSIGHALGPIAVLLRHGCSIDSPSVQSMIAFFEHYIIARQLNDDMHDWENDLAKGHLNSVGAQILKRWQIITIRSFPYAINIAEEQKALQKIFWHDVVKHAAADCEFHLQEAERALAHIPELIDANYFKTIIKPLQQSTEKVKKEQKEMIEFLSVYNMA